MDTLLPLKASLQTYISDAVKITTSWSIIEVAYIWSSSTFKFADSKFLVINSRSRNIIPSRPVGIKTEPPSTIDLKAMEHIKEILSLSSETSWQSFWEVSSLVVLFSLKKKKEQNYIKHMNVKHA